MTPSALRTSISDPVSPSSVRSSSLCSPRRGACLWWTRPAPRENRIGMVL